MPPPAERPTPERARPGPTEGARPSVLLRDMARADIRAVRRIESAAYEDAWPSRVFEQELDNGFAHYRVAVERTHDAPASGPLSALKQRVFGVDHERILGFLGVWYMVDQLHLVTIAVDPARQGEGIGQRLMLECLDLALEADLNEVVLEVRVTNERARRLYERFGFRQAGILKDYYQDNHEDAAVMLSGPLDSDAARARRATLRTALEAAHPALFEG
ncbi:MAG: ribosomal protein S18-alanine N-acetyltransferase, partial [Dehalococcoidia bacterium]